MPVLHCTPYSLYNADIVSAKGCYLYDGGGNRYADMESGVWCTVLGHGHPGVNNAIAAQLAQFAHSGYRCQSRVVESAAAAVLEALSFPDGRCVFLSSGSEAVEFALQAARRIVSGKMPYVLCLKDYFLSSYGLSATRPAETFISFELPADNDPDWKAKVDALPFCEIGVFMFEPGNGSGTVRLPGRQVIAYIAGKVKRHGGLVVADEVTTGMGRTGTLFGFEHYGIVPDIAACGKGLGNGYPVSAVALRGGIAERLLAAGFRYAQSHQNDPLGCAAALAVLTEFAEKPIIETARETGRYFLGRLTHLADASPAIHEVRGRGLMLAVELTSGSPLEVIHRSLYGKGFLTGIHLARNTLRLYPPLVIDRPLIDLFMDALTQALHAHSRP